MKLHSLLPWSIVMASQCFGATLYVDNESRCPGSGTRRSPYCSIQSAIGASKNLDVILVAPGTYHEAVDFLGKSIQLIGAEGPQSTIIDGTGLGTSVVTIISGEGEGTLLEGFTVTNGSGVEGKVGGGVVISRSAPTLSNNIIRDNSSSIYGGGVFIIVPLSTIKMTNCQITGNSSALGGGVFSQSGGLVLDGCTFSSNTALDRGGAVLCADSQSPMGFTAQNSTFWENDGLIGASEIDLIECNLTIRYSDIAGGLDAIGIDNSSLIDGGGNLDVDPLFVDLAGGDYHLQICSPLLDRGDPDFVPDVGETDIDGEPRLLDTAVDIGADEVLIGGLLDCNANRVLDICEDLPSADLTGNGVVDSADLALVLGSWGSCGACCLADLNRDDVVNAADLALLLGVWGVL